MSQDIIKNYGMSIRNKLLHIAKKENVFYQTILTRYFQERILYRLAQTKYRNNSILLEHLPSANILAYSIETVIAEKMHAIIDLADQNSRMKDFYDLYNILSNKTYNNTILQDAICKTFENRHTQYDADTMFFRKDFADNQQLQARWQAFLRKLTIASTVMFADVVSFLQKTLFPYWQQMAKQK
jgi:predicted nucleotidyltransferase component of viral defense system